MAGGVEGSVATEPGFALDPGLDVMRLRADFERDGGRVRIAPFLLHECAMRLRDHLTGRDDWRLVLNAGEKVFEMDRAGQAALTGEQRAQLERRVAAASQAGFQYRFETIRVPDDPASRETRGSLLDRFALFMSSPGTVSTLRRITGADDIAFADAQATSYGPGHFLTSHDDEVAGKGRRAAYVMGLTQDWRAEWGGLLMFHSADGDIERGLLPRFNTLNLFAVPQLHSVSYINPAAARPRISVTGWLRAGDPARAG